MPHRRDLRRFEQLSAVREPERPRSTTGVAGALEGLSAYLMKSPPKQLTDNEAHDAVERFIKQYGRKTAKPKAAQRA